MVAMLWKEWILRQHDNDSNLHQEWSLVVVLLNIGPYRCWPAVIETFEYCPHAVVSLIYSYSDTWERPTAYWEWRDGGSSVYPRGYEIVGFEVYCTLGWRWTRSCMGGSIDRVDICKIKFYICRVVLNPQLGLIDSNRRVSSDMEPQSTDPHRSKEWDGYEMSF